MPSKLDHTAEIVGDAVGTVSAATAAASKRVRQGLSEAAAAVGSSKAIDRIEKRLAPAKKAATKKVGTAKKVAKKQVTTAAKKASAAKKAGAKKVGTAKKAGAKKVGVAKKRRR